MNWKEYLDLSEKTLSYEFHVDEKKIELLLHATMGILTEVEELLDNHIGKEDPTNILEEIGDVTWYIAIIAREYNLDLPENLPLSNKDPMKIVISIIKNTSKLLDALKKKIFYNKEINEESFKQTTIIIMILVQSYMNHFNIDIEKSFDINIKKLKSRYGEKFSSEKAINRDLETEREILESREESVNPLPSLSDMYLDGMNKRPSGNTSEMYFD